MDIDLTARTPSERYHLLTQSVIPRPIAWILTANGDGVTNLAPYSFFAPVCSAPPTFVVSIGHRADGSEKDSFANLRASGQCVVNIASVSQSELLNQSAASLPAGQSEPDVFGVELEQPEGWPLPVVADSPVAYLCRYQQHTDLGPGAQHIVFLEAERLWIRDGVAESEGERLILPSTAINPLTRLGAAEYSELGERITLTRPD